MILARRLDRECIALQRQGELTVYPGFEGQEAAQIGSAHRARARRLRLPDLPRARRGPGPRRRPRPVPRSTTAAPGTAVPTIPAPRGSGRSASPSPPRSSTPSATRWARSWTARRACTLAYFGDGSASEGDFHEGANLAGVWQVPARAVLPEQRLGDQRARPRSRPPGEIWRRAEGYGFPGVRVDGNDVLAVYAVDARGGRARPRRRRPHPDRGAHLPDRRALHGRRPGPLPRRRRGRGRARVRSRSRGTGRGCAPPASRTTPFVAAGTRRPRRSRWRSATGVVATRRRPWSGCSTGPTRSRPAASGAPARGGARWLTPRYEGLDDVGALNRALRDALRRGPAAAGLRRGRRAHRAACSASPTGCRPSSAPSGCSTRRSARPASRARRSGWRSRGGASVVEMQFDAFSYPALEQVDRPRREDARAHARPRGHADHDPHPRRSAASRARSITARAPRRTTCTPPG